MSLQPFRIEPEGPPGLYETFGFTSPPDVMIAAACKDVDCEAWRHGWDTITDERTSLGMTQAAYIRQKSGRTFRELSGPEPGITVFRFESGQRCFAEHRTRPERFYQHHGDWRARTGPLVAHSSQGWVDAFGEHLEQVKEQWPDG